MEHLFVNMDEEERSSWISRYREWLAKSKPELERITSLNSAQYASFEKGFLLIAAFPFCKSFAKESLRFKDYLRRRKLFFKYIEKVNAEVQNYLGDNKVVDLTLPKLLEKHVGRPTKDEAAAKALAKEKETKEKEAKETTLFGSKVNLPQNDNVHSLSVSGNALVGSRLHLDQLRWLLSEPLQEAVDNVRNLRSLAAQNATTAKLMAERGDKPENIEPYAQAAADNTEEYEHIYAMADTELAKVYVRLKEDSTYRESMVARKVDPSELRSLLRPYWDKAKDQQESLRQEVIDDIKANDPEQAAKRKEIEEKKEKANAIIKYLCRKDKQNTLKRINTMKERYAQLVELLGDKANNYRPVLDAAIRDYESNFSKP